MHDHPAGVSVSLTGGHLRFTDETGKVTDVYAKAARLGGSLATSTRWRTSRGILQCVYVALRESDGGGSQSRTRIPGGPCELARILAEYAAATAKP